VGESKSGVEVWLERDPSAPQGTRGTGKAETFLETVSVEKPLRGKVAGPAIAPGDLNSEGRGDVKRNIRRQTSYERTWHPWSARDRKVGQFHSGERLRKREEGDIDATGRTMGGNQAALPGEQ